MKFIPKYYVGGVSVTTPMLPSVALAIELALTNSRSSGSESESGSKKSYIEQIFDPKAKMLASDAVAMSLLASSVGNFEATPAFLNMSKSQQFAAVYSLYITRARMAEANYENLMDAKKHITSNESSGEVALTNEGYMFVHKDGDKEVSLIHPSEFNRKSDIPVTNAELLYLRANDPRFAFNDKASSSLLSATSMKDIRTIIEDATRKLGSISTEPEHYINPHSPNTELALRELAQANITQADITNMDVGTLLKVKTKTKSNAKALEYALKVIESLLNTLQRALLSLRAKEIGGKATPESLILEYLNSMLNVESSFSLDIVTTKTANSSSSKTKAKTSETDSKIDQQKMPVSAEFLVTYGISNRYKFSDGSRGTLFVQGNSLPMVTKQGTALGTAPLSFAEYSGFSGILNLDSVTIGGTHIERVNLNKVLAQTQNTVNAPLPIDLAQLANGVIAPDLEATKRLDEAWRQLIARGITGKTQNEIDIINKTLQSKNLPGIFVGLDENKNPIVNTTYYARFAIINGYVDKSALMDGLEFTYHLLEIPEEEAKNVSKQFKARDKNFKRTGKSWFGGSNMYKGTIFIPLNDNIINAYAGSGVELTTSQAELLTRAATQRQKEQENPAASRYKPSPITINYE